MDGKNEHLNHLRNTLRRHGLSAHRCKRSGKIQITYNEEPEGSARAMRIALETAEELGYATTLELASAAQPDGKTSWTLTLTRRQTNRHDRDGARHPSNPNAPQQ